MGDRQHSVPPVLFIIFNRSETALRVLEGIRDARPSRLYVAADGPRGSRPSERAVTDAVRSAVLAGIDWPCEVKTLFQPENLGCRMGVKAAIDWFFSEEESGIILEDDVIPCPEFFEFCKFALEKYKNADNVLMVSGTNPIGAETGDQYFYSSFGGIWGWASWRRAWEQYDVSMAGWPSSALYREMRRRFGRSGAAYLKATFNSHKKHGIDTWDTQWTYTLVRKRGFAVVPDVNLIRNIGIVGTHSSVEMRNHNLAYGHLAFPVRSKSAAIEEDVTFMTRMAREIFLPALAIATLSRCAKRLSIHSLIKTIYSATRSKKS